MSTEKPIDQMTDEEYHNYHQNKRYFEIRKALPGDFEQFSHESLTEMIFDEDKGYTVSKLREDLRAEFQLSPRNFMLDMIDQIRKKCDTVEHLLTCKKCGIDLPKGERSS